MDCVLLGRNRNAFCVVRPPGHHAGYRGLLDGAKSCGFCIFNNVAAGALHALEGQFCERVAIIDIDVHHGNGTEDIVRHYNRPDRLFFFSSHLYEKDKDGPYEFFPGSGAGDDTVLILYLFILSHFLRFCFRLRLAILLMCQFSHYGTLKALQELRHGPRRYFITINTFLILLYLSVKIVEPDRLQAPQIQMELHLLLRLLLQVGKPSDRQYLLDFFQR